jgi:hypothetical protein
MSYSDIITKDDLCSEKLRTIAQHHKGMCWGIGEGPFVVRCVKARRG